MKFCLLENKKVAWYQRLCTIETTILKRRKKCLLYYHLCSMVSCSVWIQLCCQSCVAVSSPVTSLHLSWSDLTVMQIITPCVATKLKVCYLLEMLFFVTFNSLLAKNVLVILINCCLLYRGSTVFSNYSCTFSHDFTSSIQPEGSYFFCLFFSFRP